MQHVEERTAPILPPGEIVANGHAGAEGADAPDGIWFALGALFRWRWFVVVVTTLVALASVGLSLLLPNWYAASARVLPPEASGANPLTAALMRNAGSAASALLGGASGDYARYLAILSSRRVLESAVERFDLERVYEVQNKKSPRDEALRRLTNNVSFPVDEDYEFLSVVVLDQDPRRASQIANFLVSRLNEVNTDLTSQSASSYRRFVQKRYDEAEQALDSVLTAGQDFQRRYGILDLDVQTEAYFSQMAELRGRAEAAEIQAEALRTQYGSENDEVRMLDQVAASTQVRIAELMNGGEAMFPVARSELSTVSRQYIDLQREAAVQGQILEVVQPMLEQARFEEEKQVEAVQVIDAAVPPARKAKPRRSILVITATLSGFLFACLFAVLYSAWRRNSALIGARLRASSARAGTVATPPVG